MRELEKEQSVKHLRELTTEIIAKSLSRVGILKKKGGKPPKKSKIEIRNELRRMEKETWTNKSERKKV